ncbi:ABC transporter permease [Cohnella endophytica]|uniref:ABC transporter permease n=1 Tax=Cohnella endophytica TaxID=2419778 RepID=A0A494Y4H6_9BACL|nr:ABC transporter permease [Cohnella endophytica]RKP56940.1 ABC transporter permease [Cohnella endophytica]
MASLRAAIRNEFCLMYYRKTTLIFMVVSVVVPILATFAFRSLKSVLGIISVNSSFPIEMLGVYTAIWIPIFLFLTIAELFPHEVSTRTLKLSLLRPITRFRIYLAKLSALAVAIAALLFLLLAVTLICNALAGSVGQSLADWFGFVKAYFAGFLSMLALAAFFSWVSQFFRSSSGFLTFSIVIYAAAKIAPYFVKGFSAFSLASYTDWYVLWLSNTVASGRLLTSSLFVLSGIVLFVSLGYLSFERREV